MDKDEINRIHATFKQTIAQTTKLNVDAGKIPKKTFWYPMLIAIDLIRTT